MDQIRTQRAGSRTDPEVVAAIERLAVKGYGATQIYRELEAMQSDEGALSGRTLVDVRTIRRMLKERPAEQIPPSISPRSNDSEWWSPAHDHTGDPAMVLEVLEVSIRNSSGSIYQMSRENASRVVNLRRAAPDLDLFAVWVLAVAYERRVDEGESTQDLDCLLAVAPWRRENGWAVYERLTARSPLLDQLEREGGRKIHTLPVAPSNLLNFLKKPPQPILYG